MREREVSIERLLRVAAEAQLGGYGVMTPFEDGGFRRTMHLDMAVRCKEPYRFTLYAKHSAWARRKLAPFTITGASQCRRCENCGRSRAMRWSGRAIDEYNAWPRTVFGTFTLSPDEHYLLDARIQAGERDVDGRWSRHPVNLGLLNESQLFTARAREFGRELTKYLKRVRESRKAPLRYLMIAEAHDSERTSVEMRMRPHFHVLIHECQAGTVFLGDPHHAWTEGLDGEWVKKAYQTRKGVWKHGLFLSDDALVRSQWKLGYTKFQLAEDEGTVRYLCKYLTK